MIKIQTSNPSASSITLFSSLKTSKHHRISMNLQPICIPNMNHQLAHNPKQTITVKPT